MMSGAKISVLLLLFSIIACNRSANEKECGKPLNPNGDSELALLMRDMFKHLENEKSGISALKNPGIYPVEFEKIGTAIRSSPETGGEHFNEFCLLYISALKQYHASDSLKSQINNFNNLVRSCVACHNNECPGPVKKIEKMYIR